MRRLAGILSVALVTAGLVLLADVGITLVWKEPASAIYGSIRQSEARSDLRDVEEQFAAEPAVRGLARIPDPAERARKAADLFEKTLENGRPIGTIKIPSIDVDHVIIEGTDEEDLKKGPGHYPDTALPGQGKTIGIAGHRTTYGAPFNDIDSIEVGDEIDIETPYADFRYEVTEHEIVDPTDVGIVKDIGREQLVLTACHPLYSAAQRYAVFAKLDEVSPPGD
jgi:sortase A